MIQAILGLDWKEHFPISWGNYWLDTSDYDEFALLKGSPDSFLITTDNSNDSFIKDQNSPIKEKFLRHAADFFTLKHGEEVVGVVVCELKDWSTYYLRYIFIDKKHRHHNLTIKFVAAIEKVLATTSIDKISCDITPSNLKQVSRMSEVGYVCTGNILSERFGALIQLTKFLRPETWQTFNKNFMQMHYQQPGEGRIPAPYLQRSDV